MVLANRWQFHTYLAALCITFVVLYESNFMSKLKQLLSVSIGWGVPPTAKMRELRIATFARSQQKFVAAPSTISSDNTTKCRNVAGL